MFKFIPFGIIASIFQLVILREFSFSLAKNELAFITAAGFWIIFCALGSITETPKRIKGQPLFALSSLAFFSSITLIHTVKLFFGLKYYEPASLGLVLISSVALIGPLAFIIGNIFRFLVQDYLKSNPSGRNNYAKFFAYEAIGFFIGGLAFSLYLSKYTNPLIFSSLPVLLASAGKNNYKKITAMAIFILMAFFSFRGFNLILKNEFGRAKIIFNLGSRYGPVLSVDKSGVTVLYSEGSILVTSEDKASAEEFIHTSLSAINDVKNKAVLFIGAAFSQVAEEILKYEPASLDCLHINPVISMLAKDTFSEEISNKVSFIADDPRVYLKNTTKRYDAIMMSMPAPLNLSLNRYFTEEFFALVSSRLKYKGIFSFSIPSKRE
ncbi:MAG: hypothetical protein FJZ12_02640, partial [Candidatus Omnitrophica bacterium]|nr:hypothetical protein [Candidatus Omnitrophota bacterium]